MKKSICIFIAAAVALTAFVGCGGSNTVEEISPYPVNINGVNIEQAPRAVASLSSGLTDILLDLGCYSKIVGYSDGYTFPTEIPYVAPAESDTGFHWFWEKKPEPKAADPIPEKGEMGTPLAINYDTVAQYLPEIIFTTLPVSKAQMSKLAEVNIKLIVLPAAVTLEGVKDNYLAVAEVMYGQAEATNTIEPLIDKAIGQLDYIRAKVPSDKKSFLYFASLKQNSAELPVIATAASFEHALLSIIGDNFFEVITDYDYTAEDLEQVDPDLIFYSSDINKDAFAQDERTLGKTAVANGAVHPIDKSLFTSQLLGIYKTLAIDQTTVDMSERGDMVETIRGLAQTLYPDVDFTQPVESEDGGEGSDNSSSEVSEKSSEPSSSEPASEKASSEESAPDESVSDEPEE